jgi:hypothetical protein
MAFPPTLAQDSRDGSFSTRSRRNCSPQVRMEFILEYDM